VIEAYIGTGESDDEEDEVQDTPAGSDEEAKS
jgi:hypothetical protein